MNPILKWVGGKRKLVPELLKRMPSDADKRRHVEPFAGGAALYFARERRGWEYEGERAWLSDANPYLVGFYCHVGHQLHPLLKAVAPWEVLYRTDPASAYAKARKAFNARLVAEGDPSHSIVFDDERSALFLLLNKTCFNGLWRVNKKGQFNVPMGRYKNPKIVDEEALRAAQPLLRRAMIDWCEFDDDMAIGYSEDDFVYFDPPYVPLNPTSNFTSYSAGGFGKAHQERLASLFRHLSERGIPCMLSNSDTPLVHELYDGFLVETVQMNRPVNSDATKRGAVNEVIVRNEACCV